MSVAVSPAEKRFQVGVTAAVFDLQSTFEVDAIFRCLQLILVLANTSCCLGLDWIDLGQMTMKDLTSVASRPQGASISLATFARSD